MCNITEAKILDILDHTHDGILTISTLIYNNIRFTNEIYNAIHNLIRKGILKQRDCENFAVERIDNKKSRYGEQKFFNQYVHLTKEQLLNQIAKWDKEAHGLAIQIMDDMGSCINSRCVSSKDEGVEYFNGTYDGGNFEYSFIVLP